MHLLQATATTQLVLNSIKAARLSDSSFHGQQRGRFFIAFQSHFCDFYELNPEEK